MLLVFSCNEVVLDCIYILSEEEIGRGERRYKDAVAEVVPSMHEAFFTFRKPHDAVSVSVRAKVPSTFKVKLTNEEGDKSTSVCSSSSVKIVNKCA